MAHEQIRVVPLKSIKVRCSRCGKRAAFVVDADKKLFYSCNDSDCQIEIVKNILGMD